MRKPVNAICKQQGTDQPGHPRSLISTFVVCCLDSKIPLVSTSEISSLYLASVAVKAGVCLTWSQTPTADFLVTGRTCFKEQSNVFDVPNFFELSFLPLLDINWHRFGRYQCAMS